MDGTGVEKNPLAAVNWVRKAAEAGLADAQYELGEFYMDGTGVEKDPSAAVSWVRKAALAGHTGAQCNLGVCYMNGTGVNKDSAAAVSWFRKAAEAGHTDAQFNLGDCYENGTGVNKDTGSAAPWFRLAAGTGDLVALARLSALGCGPAANSGTVDNASEVVSVTLCDRLTLSSSIFIWGLRECLAFLCCGLTCIQPCLLLHCMQVTTVVTFEATPDDGEDWPHGGDTCVAPNCRLFGGFFCSSCLIARYCSQECLIAHRPRHKKKCKKLTRARLASFQGGLVQADVCGETNTPP
jgi:hypothetical protein